MRPIPEGLAERGFNRQRPRQRRGTPWTEHGR